MEKTTAIAWLIAATLALSLVNMYFNFNIYSSVKNGSPAAKESDNVKQIERVDVSADDDAVKGQKNAPVTIIEFSDFQCPYCQRFFIETMPQIESDYISTGKVKFIYRDFPLQGHQYAQKAAEASECADEQGKYWEYNSKIFENQDDLSLNALKKLASALNLDTRKFDECLDSGSMRAEVQKDLQDGARYGVTGTPGFFINGIPVKGAQPYAVFRQLIEQELNS